MKKYKDYNTSDFIKDDDFRKWVCDPNEALNAYWESFLEENEDKRSVINDAKSKLLVCSDLVKYREGTYSRERENKTWQNILKWKSEPGKVPGGKRNPLLKIAVGFLGVVAIALGIFKSGVLDRNNPETGSPQITLQLQDGSIQIMDETSSKIITTEKGDRVVSQERNVLVYDKNAGTENEDLVYNQLTVPYGKRFELVLSDGSHVFLNAGSSLRYPVKFLPGTPRDVFLDGEAFFEVEKDEARPFTVVTQEMNTRVYGTKFNVTSYKNENNTYTVLVEGSVGVYKSKTGSEENALTIVPGQRAVFENGNISAEEVKIEKYTAWTRGELYFMDDTFAVILKKLERHFNVQIENKFPELDTQEFTATFRDESLEKILNAYQQHTSFSYKRKGNQITITAPE